MSCVSQKGLFDVPYVASCDSLHTEDYENSITFQYTGLKTLNCFGVATMAAYVLLARICEVRVQMRSFWKRPALSSKSHFRPSEVSVSHLSLHFARTANASAPQLLPRDDTTGCASQEACRCAGFSDVRIRKDVF